MNYPVFYAHETVRPVSMLDVASQVGSIKTRRAYKKAYEAEQQATLAEMADKAQAKRDSQRIAAAYVEKLRQDGVSDSHPLMVAAKSGDVEAIDKALEMQGELQTRTTEIQKEKARDWYTSIVGKNDANPDASEAALRTLANSGMPGAREFVQEQVALNTAMMEMDKKERDMLHSDMKDMAGMINGGLVKDQEDFDRMVAKLEAKYGEEDVEYFLPEDKRAWPEAGNLLKSSAISVQQAIENARHIEDNALKQKDQALRQGELDLAKRKQGFDEQKYADEQAKPREVDVTWKESEDGEYVGLPEKVIEGQGATPVPSGIRSPQEPAKVPEQKYSQQVKTLIDEIHQSVSQAARFRAGTDVFDLEGSDRFEAIEDEMAKAYRMAQQVRKKNPEVTWEEMGLQPPANAVAELAEEVVSELQDTKEFTKLTPEEQERKIKDEVRKRAKRLNIPLTVPRSSTGR